MLQPVFSMLAVLIISVSSFQTLAQTTCKPQWDRRTAYRLKVKEIELEARIWGDRSDLSKTITQRGDTIILSRGGHVLTTFQTQGPYIVSPQVVMKDDSGTVLWIDSFQNEWNYRSEVYLDVFRGKQLSRWRYYANGMLSGVSYKDQYGVDSLVIEWSTSGIIKLKKQGNREYRYSDQGVLLSEAELYYVNGYKKAYYDNGVLKQVSFDTLVKNQLVKFIRDYSETGVLRMESWLKDGVPCETWREYNAAGTLVKTIKHKPLVQAPPIDDLVVGVEEVGPAIEYVEELAEFPGGDNAFKQKIEQELVSVFCSGGVPLEGNYTIRFEIREDGAIRFLDAKGNNVESIRPALKTFMEKLPRCKPGKHHGKRLTEIRSLTVHFSEV